MSPSMSRTALIGLILCFVALWMLQHPYGGLIQDSVLYAMAGLARLHPESLAHDIFLSKGSQDHYTLFSPLVAATIRLVGVGRAAALITAVSQAAFYCGAGLLARRLMPPRFAVLAVALLMLLPSVFGSRHIFWYTEDIMTPRVPAEALVLAALGCSLGGRYILSGLCMLGAMLIHPLIGLAGIAMLFMLRVGMCRPGLTVGLALSGLATLTLIALYKPFGPVARFDAVWFEMLHDRLQYAFPSLWSLRDWGRMSVAFSTLIIGAAAESPSTARFFCRTAIATAISGLAIALIGSDLLHIVIVTQIQTWRWLWLSNAIAVLLIPIIAVDCWRGGSAGRAALVLLAAAWISFEQTFVPVITILAVVATAVRRFSMDEKAQRRLLVGAWVILGLSLLFFLGAALTTLRAQPPAIGHMSPYLEAFWLTAHRLKPWTIGGVVPAAVFAGFWWYTTRNGGRAASTIAVILAAMLCGAFAPFAWGSWSDPAPSAAVRAKFTAWRRDIPQDAQILAPGVPVIPWFLLDRPSYWTLRQMAGAMFSRPTAMELLRREANVHRLPPAPTAAGILDGMCRSDALIGFVVTPVDMGPTPFAPVELGAGPERELLRLYRCADHRGQSSATPTLAGAGRRTTRGQGHAGG